jgi:ABC-type branched-subunit amino acid transport system permease subunit
MSLASILRGTTFAVAILVLPLFGLQHWFLNLLVFVFMFATMSSAWNLVGGFAGYPSLGHAGFFGIGAYALALIFKDQVLAVRAVRLAPGDRADRWAHRLADRADLDAHPR